MVELVSVPGEIDRRTAYSTGPELPKPLPGHFGSPEAVAHHLAALKPVAPPPLQAIDPAIARSRLKAAHGRLAEARAAHQVAAGHVLAARTAIAVLDQELEALADVDQAIARHQDEQIRAGRPVLELPSGLLARRQRRDTLRVELTAATASRDRLLAVAAEAQRAEGNASQHVAQAAETMIGIEIAAELARLEQLQADVLASERRLRGLVEVAPVQPAAAARGYAVRALQTPPCGAVYTVAHDPAVAAAKAWLDAYRLSLLASAEATIDFPGPFNPAAA